MSNVKQNRRIAAVIPGLNFDEVLGGRKGESVMGEKTGLEKKKEKIKELELESESLERETDVILRRRELNQIKQGGVPHETQDSSKSLGVKLVEEVVVPIVRNRLEEEKPKKDEDIASRALRIAERAIERGRIAKTPEESTSALDEVEKAFNILKKVDEWRRPKEQGEGEKTKGGKTEEGEIDVLERVLGVITRLEEWKGKASGTGESAEVAKIYTEQKRWEKEFERRQKISDRNFQLEMRKQDQEHKREMVKLGIEKERNEIFSEGLKRMGRAAAKALLEEEEEEEEEEEPKEKEIKKETCPGCGAPLIIPPKAQKPGTEIKCPKCNSILEIAEE